MPDIVDSAWGQLIFHDVGGYLRVQAAALKEVLLCIPKEVLRRMCLAFDSSDLQRFSVQTKVMGQIELSVQCSFQRLTPMIVAEDELKSKSQRLLRWSGLMTLRSDKCPSYLRLSCIRVVPLGTWPSAWFHPVTKYL
jgi:hypothetical protein